MNTERRESLEQVRAFVEGSDGLDFAGTGRPSRNAFARRCLYNLRKPRAHQRQRVIRVCTKPSASAISERRKPRHWN